MTIRFITTDEQLLKVPEFQPRRVVPDWFERVPTRVGEDGNNDYPEVAGFKTVRVCPGITDLYETAIMLPLWCDVTLTRCSPDQNDYPVADPNSSDVFALDDPEGFKVDWHPAAQAPGMPGVYGMTALPKMVSPWLIETDEGWSVYVTPAAHHSGTLPFEPIAGIIDTDIYHSSHLPCRWTREPGAEESIAAGTPFAYIFPFKREAIPDIETRLVVSEQELKKLDVQFDSGEYRKKRKR